MIDRQSLGWAALAAVVAGLALSVLLLWASRVPPSLLDGTVRGLGAAFAALLVVTGAVLGAFAWRTEPGKVAVIVCIILLAVGVAVFAGLMYLAWQLRGWLAAGAVVFAGLMYLAWLLSDWGG
jgi:hypothetical protein